MTAEIPCVRMQKKDGVAVSGSHIKPTIRRVKFHARLCRFSPQMTNEHPTREPPALPRSI
jgi:hypothetical protein